MMSTPQQPDRKSGRFEHLLIRASAGTGKTFQLSNRYVELVDSGQRLPEVLAVTFTRKAAGEILDRIIERVAEAALDEKAARELAQFVGDGRLDSARCRELIAAIVRNLHRLNVGTLDSFFIRLAQCFSLELGLPPGWRIVEDYEDRQLRAEAIESILNRSENRDVVTLVHLLAKGQATRSVGRLVRDTVDDMYDLFRETTAEAWHCVPRVKPLSSEQLAETVDSLRSVELPSKQMATAREKDVDRAEAEDWEAFIKTGLPPKVIADGEYHRKPIPADAAELYRRLIDHARAVLTGRLAAQNEAGYQLLTRFDAAYQSLKRERRALRFSDVTHCLNSPAAKDGGGRLAFRLDTPIEHLLLDEFQDTSLAQWQVIRPIARHVTDGNPDRSFFCVGDVKQAIYGWRGGVAEIFDAVEDELDGLTGETLDVSYRSSQPVIDTVNRVFEKMGDHPNLGDLGGAVAKWGRRFGEHSTARGELPGYACLETAEFPKHQGQDQQDATLDYAARRIAESHRLMPGATIGVLTRTNASVGKLIYRLRRQGVAASEEGGNPLTDSIGVELILSMIRLADHPGDSIARFHVLHSPLAERIDARDHRDDDAFAALGRRLRRQLIDRGYGPMVLEWARLLASHGNARERGRLEQLVQLAYEFQPTATLRATDFARVVESQRVSDATSSAVRVMTVHQAKGLQFDVVVLPELDKQLLGQRDAFVVNRPIPTAPVDRVCRYAAKNIQVLLPSPMQKMFQAAADRGVSEALCVLYVSITRAVHQLHLIVAPSSEKEKTMPRTAAGLLRASLTDGSRVEPGSVLFAHGDPAWYGRSDETAGRDAGEPDARNAETDTADHFSIRLAPSDGLRRRGLERRSPSSLEGGTKIRPADVLRTDGRAAAAHRGTIVHAWFEQIEWLEDGPPDDNVLRRIARQIVGGAADWESLVPIERFRRMLQMPAVAGALSRGQYDRTANGPPADAIRAESPAAAIRLEVSNEQAFLVADDGGRLLSGSIDRLVRIYQNDKIMAADVVDFKTDVLDAADERAVAEKVEFYRPQLQAYRRAVRRMTGLPDERISARLLFTHPGIVKDVP